MLLCKGKKCNYRKVCSRYVLGCGVTKFPDCGNQWIDHCINSKKFHRMHGTPDEKCPKPDDVTI